MAYMAPEVLAHFAQNSGEYDHKADIWSLGIAAIQMAEGHLPFRRLPKQKLIQRITTGPVPSLPSRGNWSDEFRFFISECLQRDPGRRPSARQLLTHPFIAELRGERGALKREQRGSHRGRVGGINRGPNYHPWAPTNIFNIVVPMAALHVLFIRETASSNI
uniref:Protein kinase domain-containing protein n=1 Tax=Xenopus tropicalis TaxID=8364 RepID=A0A1B8XZL7_XENTR